MVLRRRLRSGLAIAICVAILATVLIKLLPWKKVPTPAGVSPLPAPAEAGPKATASSEDAQFPAAMVFDGNMVTRWSSRFADDEWLQVDLGREQELGAVRICWESAFGRDYDLLGSRDGVSWDRLVAVRGGNGGKELLVFGCRPLRFLKLQGIKRGSPWGYSIFELQPLSPKEAPAAAGEGPLSPERHFELQISRFPPGAFPRWLGRQMEYWTIIGVPDDDEESLFSEYGAIEPRFGGFTVMPFLRNRERLLTTAEGRLTQSLADGDLPLPNLTWNAPEHLKLAIDGVATGPAGRSVTLVRYTLRNEGSAPADGTLILAVRPIQLNPPWQFGGASPIKSAEISGDRRTFTLNGRIGLWALDPPDSAWCAARQDGDALAGDTRQASARDESGIISIGLAFDWKLQPGAQCSWVIALPLHEGSAKPAVSADGAGMAFQKVWDREKSAWRERLGGWRITAPLEGLEQTVRANVAYILLTCDRSAYQPGARNYASSWTRDGTLSAIAMLRYRQTASAVAYMNWLARLVFPEGYVPPIARSYETQPPQWSRDWKEFDAFGEFVLGVRQVDEFTHDRAWLERMFPVVVRAMQYQDKLISERRTEKYRGTEYFGLLPESNSHEGYNPARHSYWDDFFALRGLADASAMATRLGKRDEAARLKAEAEHLRADLFASMRKVIARNRLEYLPGCAELGDFDPSSTAIALDYCGEGDRLGQVPELARPLKAGFARYYREASARWTSGKVTDYAGYEARNIDALARLGERNQAAELLRYFLGSPQRPQGWREMGEVIHADPRVLAGIGDMPHTWVGAEFINSVRSLFVREDEDAGRLVLAGGVPESWLESGVEIQGFPTWWGDVHYRIARDGKAYVVTAGGTAAPPNGFVLALPFSPGTIHASADGHDLPIAPDGTIAFPKLPLTLRLERR